MNIAQGLVEWPTMEEQLWNYHSTRGGTNSLQLSSLLGVTLVKDICCSIVQILNISYGNYRVLPQDDCIQKEMTPSILMVQVA